MSLNQTWRMFFLLQTPVFTRIKNKAPYINLTRELSLTGELTGEQTSVTKVVSPGSFQWIVKMVENQVWL